MAIINKKIAFIGSGHITELIIDNLVKHKLVSGSQLIASDPKKERLILLHQRYDVVMADSNIRALEMGDYIFINVLPQTVNFVIKELSANKIPPSKVFITLAAGIPIEKIGELGVKLPVVRVLPNPPSHIGMGIIPIAFNEHVTVKQKEDMFTLFRSLGECQVLPEDKINAVTSLSSPASVYLFFQSLINAGVKTGLDRKTSEKVVYHTVAGCLEVWKQRDVSPSILMDEACSPGGISVESLFTLEKYAFRGAIMEAIENGKRIADQFSEAIRSRG